MATARFVGLDTGTRGTWLGVYGLAGYYKLEGAGPSVVQSRPSWLDSVAESNTTPFAFDVASSDPIDLQRADGSARDGDAWYAGTSLAFKLAINDGATHRIRVYCLDIGSAGRSQDVVIHEGDDGAVLDTQSLAAGSYTSGAWLTWDVTGPITIRANNTGSSNAVASGLFFDAPPRRRPRLTAIVAAIAAGSGGGTPRTTTLFRRTLYRRAGSRGVR